MEVLVLVKYFFQLAVYSVDGCGVAAIHEIRAGKRIDVCLVFDDGYLYNDGLDDVVEEAGDGEGTDAAGGGGDGGEVFAFANLVCKIAF